MKIFKEKSHFKVKCLLILVQYVIYGYLWPGRKLTLETCIYMLSWVAYKVLDPFHR